MSKIVYPFDIDDNYIFDPTKIEIVSTNVKLVATIIGAQAAIYLKLDDNQGLVAVDSSGNNNHGAFQGGLDENDWGIGKINSDIDFPGSGFINLDQQLVYERTDAFSFECWFKFTNSGTQAIVSKQLGSAAFQGISLNTAGGLLRFVVRDINGNNLTVETAGAYNDGSFHHVVGTYDGLSVIGGLNLYIDNALDRVVSSSTTLDSTLTSTADLQVSARDGSSIPLLSGSSVDEVVIYSRELTPAEIDVRWNGGAGTQTLPGASTSYPVDSPTMQTHDFLANNIRTFTTSEVISGSDSITFVVTVNGQDKYWDGANWVDSIGVSQSNNKSTMNSNISSLVFISQSFVSYKAFLTSFDGSTTPELLNIKSNFDLTPSDINLQLLSVSSKLFDLNGEPIPNESISVQLDLGQYENTNIVISKDKISTFTGSNGNWNIVIKIEDVLPTRLFWTIQNEIIVTDFLLGNRKFSEFEVLNIKGNV